MKDREINKQKMLIFHPVLATYRIDQFNLLSAQFELEVVFLFNSMWNFNMDQKKIEEQCNFKISYLLHGPRYKGRVFRFGMYKKIHQFKPDIIIGYEFSFTTQYLLLLKHSGLINQKIGSFIDDSIEMCNNPQTGIRSFARKSSVKYLDFIIVMSDVVSDFYRSTFNLNDNQVIVSPILQLAERLRKGTDEIEEIAKEYSEKLKFEGKKVLLFVGRFIPEKGLEQFIASASSLLKREDNSVIVLIGDGSEINSLKAKVIEVKLEDRILFPGKFQAEELYAWYALASGFILPSLFEPFGAVVNEALIFGVSVFCSSYAGASSLINSSNGVIFNPKDADNTVEKLSEFLNKIAPVEEIKLSEKKPLIEDHRDYFKEEWRKLAYA